MRYSYPCLIDNFFNNTAEKGCVSLSLIQRHTILLLTLNRVVNTLLPEMLRPWCSVANVRQGVMILEIANASWRTRLQYEQPQLLSALKNQILPSLSSIDIRINPSLAIKQECYPQKNNCHQQLHWMLREKPRYLSLQSAIYISHVAANSEGKLKNILERLTELARESYSPPTLEK